MWMEMERAQRGAVRLAELMLESGGVLGAYARALKMEEERRVLRGRTLLLVLVLLLVEVVWLVLMLGLLKG
jgi:hypothetical protein